MLKKITVGIIILLLAVVLGLVWNLGRNQKPPQEAVETLKQALNFQQSVTSSQSTTNSQFSTFSQSNNSIQNSSSQINNSTNSSFSSISQNYSSQISINSFSSKISSAPSSSNSVQDIVYKTFSNGEIIKNSNNQTTNLKSVLPNNFENKFLPTDSFFLRNGQEKVFISKGLSSIDEFDFNGKKYWFASVTDVFGTSKLYLSEAGFLNILQIKILEGEIMTKITKIDNNGLFTIQTKNGNGRTFETKDYKIDLKKAIENPSASVIVD
jgi:hypothetical protein